MAQTPDSEPFVPSYAKAKQNLIQGMLRQSELPIGHYLSLLVPTTRWGEPGFAFFASPCIRRLDGPSEQAAPDRWGVLAVRDQLILYARVVALPLPGKVSSGVRVLRSTDATVQEVQTNLARLEEIMEMAAPVFFARQPITEETRRVLQVAFSQVVPEPLLSDYRALSPEFFDWLGSGALT